MVDVGAQDGTKNCQKWVRKVDQVKSWEKLHEKRKGHAGNAKVTKEAGGSKPLNTPIQVRFGWKMGANMEAKIL